MAILLFDTNNLAMRNLFHREVGADTEEPQLNLWKYLIFDQIYWSIVKFKEYNIDEVILAVDSHNTWRKLYFPRYKEKRKKKEDIDWDLVFSEYQKFQDEVKKYLPIKVLKINSCEADDIIGTLCLNLPDKEFIIISNDIDYKQLCGLTNVKVFEPKNKKFVECENTDKFLTQLCLTGQSKDGILNSKTPSDYPSELRNPGLGEKTAEKILDEGLDKFLDKEITINKKYKTEDGEEKEYKATFKPRELFERNSVLLDFTKIPKVLTKRILECYSNYQLPELLNMYQFFEEQGWTSFMESFDITEKVLMKLN